jgi:hypothetical protein
LRASSAVPRVGLPSAERRASMAASATIPKDCLADRSVLRNGYGESQKAKERRSYRTVVILLEELSEIVSILKEAAKDVQISTEDYRFATVDELKEHYNSQAQFAMEITSLSPYVHIEFTHLWVKAHVASGPQSAKLFHEIDIFVQRQRGIFYSWWWIVLFFVAGAAAHFIPEQSAITAVQLVLAVWFLWVMFVSLRRTAVINLQRRSEARPFLERNKIS